MTFFTDIITDGMNEKIIMSLNLLVIFNLWQSCLSVYSKELKKKLLQMSLLLLILWKNYR
jgi:hypothetical protein